MGLMDKISEITNGLGREKNVNQGLLDGLIDMFTKEGVGSLLKQFKGRGLDDIVSSWIGLGSNKSVSADQIKDVLGEDKLRDIAQRAGISESDSSNIIKDILPDIIDKATPDGVLDPDD